MSEVQIGVNTFSVRLRGRAWILADSYQVAHLESDLAEEVPEIRLRLQHQDIEYRPVTAAGSKAEIWLPSSTELYSFIWIFWAIVFTAATALRTSSFSP